MDYDDEILLAFKKASEKGRKEISTEAILMLTDVPEDMISKKLKVLEKYKMVRKTESSKQPKSFWRLWD